MWMGIGDWGLGIGEWAQSPIPKPQSPSPKPQSLIFVLNKLIINFFENLKKYKYILTKELNGRRNPSKLCTYITFLFIIYGSFLYIYNSINKIHNR